MAEIVVVGSLNVDLALRAKRLPSPGETVRADALEIGPGGKGCNQAIAAARLGAHVHMVGWLGDDRFAEVPERALAEAGVDLAHLRRAPGTATGMAAIVVSDETGQNQIAVFPGANREVTPEQVRDAAEAFRASTVLLVQLELPLATVDAALDLARESGCTTILDPAPARELPDDLLRKVDVLTPNETEASLLCGHPVSDVESAAAAGSRLCERTGADVLVTLGAQGVVWVRATGFQHLPAPAVEAVDTTGAGDAFNGALAVALADREPLVRALGQALRAGSDSTRRPGAAASMPTQRDLKDPDA
ncbi:MAG: ribokinase [Myxococcota bacterium]|nr:ribokinase [Myxococcota bacterium]